MYPRITATSPLSEALHELCRLLIKHDTSIATVVDPDTDLTLLICRSEREAVNRICTDHAVHQTPRSATTVLQAQPGRGGRMSLLPPSTPSRSFYGDDDIDESELARLDSTQAQPRGPLPSQHRVSEGQEGPYTEPKATVLNKMASGAHLNNIASEAHSNNIALEAHSNMDEAVSPVTCQARAQARARPSIQPHPRACPSTRSSPSRPSPEKTTADRENRRPETPRVEAVSDDNDDGDATNMDTNMDINMGINMDINTEIDMNMDVDTTLDPVVVEDADIVSSIEVEEEEESSEEERVEEERVEGAEDDREDSPCPSSSTKQKTKTDTSIEMKVTNRNRRKLAEQRKKKIMQKSAAAKARFDERCRIRSMNRRAYSNDNKGAEDNTEGNTNDEDNTEGDTNDNADDDADNEATPAPPDVPHNAMPAVEPGPGPGPARSPTIEVPRRDGLRSSSLFSSTPSTRSSQHTESSRDPDEAVSSPLEQNMDLQWLSAQLAASKSTKAQETSVGVREKMIRSAYLIGSSRVMRDWQDIYQHWRSNGCLNTTVDGTEPLSHCEPLSLTERNSQLKGRNPEFLDFFYAWNRVQQLEVNSLLYAIRRRQRLAELSDAYDSASSTVEFDTTIGDKTALAQAKRKLFLFLHPGWSNVPSPASNPITKQAYKRFDNTITRGRRWSYISRELGPGVLALIPESLVTNKFVEMDLVLDQFYAWVALIRHVNPDCVRFGEAFLAQMQSALQGGAVPKKRLKLETITRADIQHTADKLTLLEAVNEGQLTSGDEREMLALLSCGEMGLQSCI